MYLVEIAVVVALVILFVCMMNKKKEHMSGFGVTSALAMYNRHPYCEEGNGGAYSGGCFLDHRVIF